MCYVIYWQVTTTKLLHSRGCVYESSVKHMGYALFQKSVNMNISYVSSW